MASKSKKKSTPKKVTRSYTTTSGQKVTKYSDGSESRSGGSSSSSSSSSSNNSSSSSNASALASAQEKLKELQAELVIKKKEEADAKEAADAKARASSNSSSSSSPSISKPTNSQSVSKPTVSLQPGSSDSSSVKQLQNYLVSEGFLTQSQMDSGPGIYGPQTTAAVKKYQEANGVDNSSGPGYWGPRTISASDNAGNSSSGSSTPTPPKKEETTVPADKAEKIEALKQELVSIVEQAKEKGVDTTAAEKLIESVPASPVPVNQEVSVPVPTVPLQPGSTDKESVKELQDFLVSQGVMTQAQVDTGYGTYGPQTKAAVKEYQQEIGVDNSSGPGFWGPRTIAASENAINNSTESSTPVTKKEEPVVPVENTQKIEELKQELVSIVEQAKEQGVDTTAADKLLNSLSTSPTPVKQEVSVTAPTVSLQPGSTDSASVKQLQDYLVSSGFMTQAQVDTGYGTYGPQTTAAVKAYQQAKGIDNSSGPGYWGPRTIAASSEESVAVPAVTENTQKIEELKQELANVVEQAKEQGVDTTAADKLLNSLTESTVPAKQDVNITAPTVSLQPGSTDTASIKQLQDYLVSKGFMTQAQVDTGYGTYGPQTTAAVKAYQEANGVDNSSGPGFWGPRTIATVPSGASSPSIPPSDQPSAPVIVTPEITALAGQLETLVDQAKALGIDTTAADKVLGNIAAGTQPTGIQDESAVVNSPVISPTETKPNNPATTDIPNNPVTDDQVGNSGITTLPQDAFNQTPHLEPGTPEYKKAMEKISTAYYDVLQQQMNAKTEQDQQAAQYSWETLKKNIETGLKVSLSGDAIQAWDQIQGLQNSFGQNNTAGSGLQDEATDDYLRKIRNADANSRLKATSDNSNDQMNYYKKFATPEQIKALIASDPEKAESWGLIPSSDIQNAMSVSSLKKKYPTLSDEQIDEYRAQILDENGNYRSTLYQNYMTGSNLGANEGTKTYQTNPDGSYSGVTVTPSDSGVFDIKKAKDQYVDAQVGIPELNANLAINKKNQTPNYTDPANATAEGTLFNQPAPKVTTPSGTGTNSTNTTGTNSTNTTGTNSTNTTTIKPPTTTYTPIASRNLTLQQLLAQGAAMQEQNKAQPGVSFVGSSYDKWGNL